ncbi:hypothetical protein [Halorubrum ezzemoulense]|uniref:hypothetical protein n=1 Tax=Halorubrum ezzemoulense TaxID=337243 RepID=UPI00232EF20D|nr:hypothetical protein [Halorubrum ezzemoulense]MDB9252635.1 hypothetical protein [Halorubrum ezzemoulense]MDB9257158.1 hypothetical protein [Halorubrum ezzemoulense]MDB9277291.1 hypothetical protein [Halorubrum ezzemoulense]
MLEINNRYLIFVMYLTTSIYLIKNRLDLHVPDLFYDAREVWYPLAKSLSKGGMLYVEYSDNKPPLFEYLNYLVYSTGHYILVFHLLIALANTVAAMLLYTYVERNGYSLAGITAGFLWLLTLPPTHGTIINVRSFASIGLLGALLLRSPTYVGISMGLAGLFSQFIVFAIPSIIAREFLTKDNISAIKYILTVGLASLVTVAVCYASLAIPYGLASIPAAIQDTIISSNSYVSWERFSILDPTWPFRIRGVLSQVLFVIIPAIMYLVLKFRRGFSTDQILSWSHDREIVLLLALFLSTLLIKSLLYYWIFPLLFISALAGKAVSVLYYELMYPILLRHN